MRETTLEMLDGLFVKFDIPEFCENENVKLLQFSREK
jgi:hypothetical protein